MYEFLIVLIIMLLVAAPVLAIIAIVQVRMRDSNLQRQAREIAELRRELQHLQQAVHRGAPPPAAPPEAMSAAPPEAPMPTAAPPPEAPPPRVVRWETIPARDFSIPQPFPSAPEPPADADQEMRRLEENLGKRWITWIGVLALFLSVGFLVKYAFDNQWIGPTGRVVLGVMAGLALLVTGDRAIRRQWHALGQGLLGGGLAILYVSLFASFNIYHLVSPYLAFALMVLVTAGGMTLAILHNAVALAALAILGGFLTPVMVSSGGGSHTVLFAYLLLLDLGVLGVAFFKRWRAIDFLAFSGTWILFIAWYNQSYQPTLFLEAVAWVMVFYLLFLVLPFIYHFRYREPVPVERFVLAMLNAGIAFWYAYLILAEEHRAVLAFVALGMSATSLVMGSFTRQRLPADAPSLFGFITLAVAFLTMAIPLQLRTYGISLAWAIEGPALLYLGYRFRYFPVRLGGFIVLLLAITRLFAAHWPLHEAEFMLFLNRNFVSAITIPVVIGLYAVIHHLWRRVGTSSDRLLKVTGGLAAGFLGLIVLQAEITSWFHFEEDFVAQGYASALVWALGGMAFLAAGIYMRSLAARVAGIFPLIIAIIIGMTLYDDEASRLLLLNLRFLVVAVVIAALFLYRIFNRLHEARHPEEAPMARALTAYPEIYLLIILSLEAHGWGRAVFADLTVADSAAQMAITIIWGLYAIVLLTVGFRRRMRPMRLCALAIFGMAALKLLIIDMAAVEQIFRILSFFVLGLLMIGASYLYHRTEQQLSTRPEDPS